MEAEKGDRMPSTDEAMNVADMLERVADKELADIAEMIAKMYEPIERAYSSSMVEQPLSLLAASTNRRSGT